jgi:DNA modification methylase
MIQAQKGKEQHLGPLQFDIVERLIARYSNEGDIVFDPFAGIMTVPFCAMKLGRFGIGVELNAGYWADGVTYLQDEDHKHAMPSLFDALEAVA